MKKFFLCTLLILTGCVKYSENVRTASSALEDGVVLYSYGETNGKLDWLVFQSGSKGVALTSRAVLKSSNGNASAELTWNGILIELDQSNHTIYDATKGLSYKIKSDLTIKTIQDEIYKSGINFDLSKFAKLFSLKP